MIRWIQKRSQQPARRWQSRAEILKAHLDSLSPDELRSRRPDYYWLRFGHDAWKRRQTLTEKVDPNQPRVPAGNPDGGQWTSEATGGVHYSDPMESFGAARRRGRSALYCMAKYAEDGVTCNSVKPASRARACWKQAAERLGNCLAGRQVPDLIY